MNLLKKIFPMSFMSREKNTNSLVLSILLHAAVIVAYFIGSGVLGYLLGTLAAWLLGLFGTLVGLYCAGGVVMSVLCYCGILK